MRFFFILQCMLSMTLFAESGYDLSQSNHVITLPEGVIHSGSYYRFGDAHEVLGTVQGDACLVGSDIVVGGIIEGNLIAIGGTLLIKGKVLGNVVALAGQTSIQGEVKGKIFCGSMSVETTSQAIIDENLVLVGGHVGMDGLAQQGLIAIAGSLDVAGTVYGNVRAFTGQLSVKQKGKILGNLRYRSQNPAELSPGSEVIGKIEYIPSFFDDLKQVPLVKWVVFSSQIATKLMGFFYSFLMGIILLRFYRKRLQLVFNRLDKHPLSSLIWGISIVTIIPIISVILLVSVIGAPFALTLLALNVIGIYTAKILPILYFSNQCLSKLGWQKNTVLVLFVGLVSYYVITAIPIFGWFVSFVTMLLGLGASVSAQLHRDN